MNVNICFIAHLTALGSGIPRNDINGKVMSRSSSPITRGMLSKVAPSPGDKHIEARRSVSLAS